ncbi:MAG: tRNA (adenosine(37)-N6)-threonylcarbamoyltransferase complex dimerization subunit type 1 TsaB [Microscillaceae bacterium]
MSVILSLETATSVCSVSLHRKGVLCSEVSLFVGQSHSVMLHPMIDQVLTFSQESFASLSAVAISKGPGSYTGLRIGTSTAKGLCYALDLPLLAVNTLEAMARAMQAWQSRPIWLCPMIDARRMEVYCALYDENGQCISPTEARIIDESSFEEYLFRQDILFFGDGAAKCQPHLSHQPRAHFQKDFYPQARAVGQLAEAQWQAGEFMDVAYFEPYYLKDFINQATLKN